MQILVTDGMDGAALEALRNLGHRVTERAYSPEDLGPALGDFDAVVVRSATKLRRPQLEAARGGRLRLIIRGGVGLDNIDVSAAESMGIAVRNTPGAATNAVAELALGLMLSCARSISAAGHSMRQGKWEKKNYSRGFELRGRTLGIIGCGRVGMRLAALAQGLGMEVLACHRNPRAAFQWNGVGFVPKDALLARADVISLNTPALSHPAITGETIGKMKDGVVIINTSRGRNLDERALLEGLNSGKIRAAGLDVWEGEPAPNPALVNHPAVSCTPHIGASTAEAQRRIGLEIVRIIREMG